MGHYVDVSKRLSSPTKCGRVLYVSRPFFECFKPVSGGPIYKQEDMDWYFKEATRFSKETHVVAPLQTYKKHHEILIERLPEIKDLKFIFIPGISPDLNEVRPDFVGHDIFSERFRLSKNILEVFNKLDIYFSQTDDQRRELLEDYCIMAVAPFALSIAKVERDDSKDLGNQLYLKYPFEDIYDSINYWLIEQKKRPIKMEDVMLEKRLDQDIIGQKGITEFSDFLYDLEASRDVFIDYQHWPKEKIEELEKNVSHSIYLNKQMLAAQWSKIFDLLEKERPTLFIKKTSPFYQAVDRFGTHEIDLIGGKRGFLRNMPISPLAECHPSALSFLEGRIMYKVKHGN